jgi:SAM-dependent methyltransferase
MSHKENTVQFWDEMYVSQNTGWDLDGPTPVFEKISKTISKGKVCILGCGRGYDAVMFAENDFKVTAVDFAPEAIKSLNKLVNKKKVNLTVLQEDIFNLEEQFFEYFDYVIEQTCFCAIHPTRRLDYAHLVKNILKKNGRLIGLWLPLNKKISEGGPPYGTSVKEVKSYFKNLWEVEIEEFPELSVSSRINKEKLIIFKKL